MKSTVRFMYYNFNTARNILQPLLASHLVMMIIKISQLQLVKVTEAS